MNREWNLNIKASKSCSHTLISAIQCSISNKTHKTQFIALCCACPRKGRRSRGAWNGRMCAAKLQAAADSPALMLPLMDPVAAWESSEGCMNYRASPHFRWNLWSWGWFSLGIWSFIYEKYGLQKLCKKFCSWNSAEELWVSNGWKCGKQKRTRRFSRIFCGPHWFTKQATWDQHKDRSRHAAKNSGPMANVSEIWSTYQKYGKHTRNMVNFPEIW